jgi:hypothetical protein
MALGERAQLIVTVLVLAWPTEGLVSESGNGETSGAAVEISIDPPFVVASRPEDGADLRCEVALARR